MVFLLYLTLIGSNMDQQYPKTDLSLIIKVVIDQKYWLISIAIITSALAILYNKHSPPLYRSTVQIYIDAPSMAPEMVAGFYEEPTNVVKRFYHEAASVAMLQHLIKKFDLGEHYGLPTNQPFRAQRILDRLQNRIDVKLVEHQSMKVTVEDRDIMLAANMANEIYLELVRRNERRVTSELKKTQRLYRDVADNLEKRSRNNEKRVYGLLDSLSRSDRYSERISSDLISAISRMAFNGQDGANVRQVQQFLASFAQKGNMPSILLVRKASYDIGRDPIMESVWWVAGITLAILILWIVAVVVWRTQGKQSWDELKGDIRGFSPEPIRTSTLKPSTIPAQNGHEVPLDALP